MVKFLNFTAVVIAVLPALAFAQYKSKILECQPISNCKIEFQDQNGDYAFFVVKLPSSNGAPNLNDLGEIVNVKTKTSEAVIGSQNGEDPCAGGGANGPVGCGNRPQGLSIFNGKFAKSKLRNTLLLVNVDETVPVRDLLKDKGTRLYDLCGIDRQANQYSSPYLSQKFDEPIEIPRQFDPKPILSITGSRISIKDEFGKTRTSDIGERILSVVTLKSIPFYELYYGYSSIVSYVRKVTTPSGVRYFYFSPATAIGKSYVEYFVQPDGSFVDDPAIGYCNK